MMKMKAAGESKYMLLARGKECKNKNSHQFYPVICAFSFITNLKAAWGHGNFWGWLAMQSFTIFLNSLSHLSGAELPPANPVAYWKIEMELSASNQTTDTLTIICVCANNGYANTVWPEK